MARGKGKAKTAGGDIQATEPNAAAEPAADNALANLQNENEELKKQLAEKADLAQGYFAQVQRVQADFDNYQKRIESEKSRIADQACETIVSGLLDTLDNLERAIAHLEKSQDDGAKGVLLVYETMLAYLKTNGLERIATAGCRFDPHRHDAIMQAEVETGEDGAVLEEFQAGYTVKGKVIRPSKVRVARLKIQDDNNVEKED